MKKWTDALLTVLVAVTAYAAAHAELTRSFRVAPAIEDLVAACHGRPGWMPNPEVFYQLPAWTALYERRIAVFPCEAIAGVPLVPMGTLWEQQQYFHLTLYAWFRVVGPTVGGFLSFQSASYAVTCVLAFLIFRLALGPLIALACAAGFVFSASHLGKVGLPIEYAKAPWVLAVVLLCGVVVTRDGVNRPIRWVALALGLVAGLGIGFKQDLLTVAPLAVATPLLFVRARAGDRLRKLAAVGLVLLGIAAGGGVMIYRNLFAPAGSLFAVQILGGQDWQTESLHAVSPLYDYGITWDDGNVVTMLNSYGRRVLGTTRDAGFFSKELQGISTDLVMRLWSVFSGDLVLRMIAAAVRVAQLNELSPFVALAGLAVVFGRSLRLGWFVLFVAAYLSAGVSLVFQRRHVFHLEFLPWLLAGIVVSALLSTRATIVKALRDGSLAGEIADARRRLAPPARRTAVSLLAVMFAVWAALGLARMYQQRRVLALVGQYQDAASEPMPLTWEPRGADETTARMPGFSLDERVPAAANPIADYVAARFTCNGAGTVPVKSKYFPPEDQTNWSREFEVVCSGSGTTTMLLLPVYQYGRYRYDGLVMRKADASRLESVSVIRADDRVPLFLDLQIPGDWRTRSWFERMKSPIGMPP